ncbi:hypothetical protein SAMN05421819_4324 [Bryocella elongata]|uniref:CAAX prenyl protease 2/Lysostaphin resistance protein A-like domain-containing protein n=1 Tax=Bryocella elongata TaxID=863522 RepID=A0A1H6C8G9_9BACT|nr:CPBP family intramembrane glutamic endopeptidase [Bryocella elongata]SEG69202.1 hypothetical protein SAMN05421819_4324 [Bryocella elongata]
MNPIIDPAYRSSRIFSSLGAATLLICLYILSVSRALTLITSHLPSSWLRSSWRQGYVSHVVLLLVALAFMAILKPYFGGSFGLRVPQPGRSFIWPALWIGASFGMLMLCVDYYSNLIHRTAPPGPFAINPGNVIPWLLMQGLVVGITEEAVFRGLFLGYLLSRVSYRIRFGGFQVSVAGILIAVVFSLAHAGAFWHTSLFAAIGQQIYAIAIGIFCAYLFEQSDSLLAPAIAHSAGDFVEWSCCFAMTALWHK